MQAESSRQKTEFFLLFSFSFELSAKIATDSTPALKKSFRKKSQN